ncbi:3-ketoacyl-CoA thiolase [wastewater metagenome]|uniref:3-ketoacyl-CoA thiolase n=2 Tax=unclassified sequences TaxID=12908 RepID=A0A5B8RDM5_9ZZZZ|nr:acetyl-CoA acetyltransferase [Arhodomonas sp. KWT]QEA06706.1 3-ketoacyl-CoA thiolase [uncultured organism]
MAQYMIGWGHTRFGKLSDEDVESLIARAATEAMEDAGVDGSQIDAVFVGNFNSGMNPQEFPASLVLEADPALRFKPTTRVENACASGSAAIHQGLTFLQAGRGQRVLVVGVEKMTDADAARVAQGLLGASYRREPADPKTGFAGVFGNVAEAYFQRYGDQEEVLARIAAKNHRNGAKNPLAHLQKDLGLEFCSSVSEKNPLVAGRLKRSDCSPVSDGAAAVVLADESVARQASRSVRFRSTAHVTEHMPMARREPTRFEGAEQAWQRVLAGAGVGLADLAFAEVHDCFTIAELMIYEAMGLTPIGEGRIAIEEGWTELGGKLPVNPSGGLKAKGHPVGATGVSMHVMAARQLLGEAGELQVPDAELAAVFNMGGVAVANYASILERTA